MDVASSAQNSSRLTEQREIISIHSSARVTPQSSANLNERTEILPIAIILGGTE